MALLRSLFERDWFVGLIITLLFLIFAETGVFSGLDRQAYDLGTRISSAREPRDDIVIVAVDDESLQKLGAWPWSRDVLAQATLVLTQAKPSVIGFTIPFDTAQYAGGLSSISYLRDVLVAERKLSRNVRRALDDTESTLRGDDKLAGAFRSGARIVLSMPYIASERPASEVPATLPKYLKGFTLPGVSLDGDGGDGAGRAGRQVTRVGVLFPPIEKLVHRAASVGVIGFNPRFNNEPLLVQYGEEFLPSFALMLAARSKGLSSEDIESRGGAGPTLNGKTISADRSFRIYPRIYDDNDGKPAFESYSLIDVLNGSIDASRFQNKIIIVGLTSPRLAGSLSTPSGQTISPTLATAHTVSSLLNNELFELPEWAGWAQRSLIVALGIYLMFALGRFRTSTETLLSLFLLLVIFNTHFILMSSQALWVPMVTAVVMLIVGHLILGMRRLVGSRLY